MPLALVSDVHGNDVALARFVAELERLGAEHVVFLGDGRASGWPHWALKEARWRNAS